MLADPVNGKLLPFREPFGRIDTKNVGAGLHQSGNTLSVISGIDPGPHHIALVTIQQFIGIFLVGIVVLAENKSHHSLVFVEDGKGVKLMIPNNVIGLFQTDSFFGIDNFFNGGHKFFDFHGFFHAADAVIAAGNNADHFAVGGAVFGHSHSGMTCFFF